MLERRDDAEYETLRATESRHQIRKKQRRLGRELGGEVTIVDRSCDMGAVDAYMALESSGYKARIGVAMTTVPGEPEYFREMCERFAAAGRLHLLALEAAGRPVAMNVWLRAGDGVFMIKSSFDHRYARFSPGISLHTSTLPWFHEHTDAHWIDTCTSPDNELLLRLYPDRRRVTSFFVVLGRSPRDRLVLRSFLLLRPVHRRIHGFLHRRRKVTWRDGPEAGGGPAAGSGEVGAAQNGDRGRCIYGSVGRSVPCDGPHDEPGAARHARGRIGQCRRDCRCRHVRGWSRSVVATIMRPEGTTGVQAAFRSVIELFETRGHDVSLVTPFSWARPLTVPFFGPRRLLQACNGPAGIAWYRWSHLVMLHAALRRRLARSDTTVVYAQCPVSALAALESRTGAHQRVVMAVHFDGSQADEWADKGTMPAGCRVHRRIRELERDVVSRLDGIVFVSESACRALLGTSGSPRPIRSVVIPNFVSPAPVVAAPESRADLVTVGALDRPKNQQYLIRVLAAAGELGARYRLDIVGDGPERPRSRSSHEACGSTTGCASMARCPARAACSGGTRVRPRLDP